MEYTYNITSLSNSFFYSNYLKLQFDYKEYPTNIKESDIRNFKVLNFQSITIPGISLGSFTPSGPMVFQNGNNAQIPSNVLIFTILGELKAGLEYRRVGFGYTQSVLLEFAVHMSSNYHWRYNTGVGLPGVRFPASEVNVLIQ